jgi:L-2-hydroxyglutarate oxidase LhgO
MERIECVVIGAGVVGLAVGRALAQRGLDTLLLESERSIGCGTSSRNSEVLHAGIYYEPGSLKAELCVRGRALMEDFCTSRGVPHRRCGKFIVATDDAQAEALDRLLTIGQRNGVEDLQPLSAAAAMRAEPALRCVAALHSGATGIVDSHALMLALQGDFERAGGTIAFGAPVLGGRVEGNGLRLEVGGDEPMTLHCDRLVNSAGLQAQAVAAGIEGLRAGSVPGCHYAKGSYYSLAGRAPFSRLIYPVPEPGGLGVHLTLDLGGQARFGPDVEWVDAIDYRVDPARAEAFYASIRRYWPALPDGALQPAYSGIRPKLHPAGGGNADFQIQTDDAHGVPGLVNLFGIESPGLTASLAIAERIAGALLGTA